MTAATLDSLWQSVIGGPIDDAVLEWPPDVFALTDIALERTETYRFAVSPPPGAQWPPPAVADWSSTAVATAEAWTAWAHAPAGPPPDLVATAWATIRDAASTPLDDLASGGAAWPLCAALLTLHAVADEACAGMGVAIGRSSRRTDGSGPASAVRGRARELLARTGSLTRAGLSGVRVLPKVRTPAGGISLRSLARYACVRGPAVDTVWHKAPSGRPGVDPRRQQANVLLLPWPLQVRVSDFHPLETSVRRTEREPYGLFTFEPGETFDVGLVDRVVAAALDEVDAVDLVVLPESAVPGDKIPELEDVLARRGVAGVIAGVRDTSPPDGSLPGNWVHLGVRLGGRWWRYRQNKHHRWSLDENQILQYHIGGALHPALRWWEAMEVPRRQVQFLELGGGITVVAVICEDLARLDAVAELLRTVGPTLVLTVLLDGPQLASRWTARYASVLADDPGSAVLTLSSVGMVERSRPDGHPPSRVVALWKDPTRGIRQISLDAGAHGVLLSTSVEPATRHSADGRFPADDTVHLRDVGVHQVRAAAEAQPDTPLPAEPTGEIDLDEQGLTVLAGWAEAVAEARRDGTLDVVLADASPAAGWRAALGVQPPSAALGAALDALTGAARSADAGVASDGPYERLARDVLDAAGVGHGRRGDPGAR